MARVADMPKMVTKTRKINICQGEVDGIIVTATKFVLALRAASCTVSVTLYTPAFEYV